MKEEWLFPGATVPIDAATTAALVAEIKRLIDVVGGMALAQPEGCEAGRLAEREACANVCKQQSLLQLDERVMRGIDACTDAILARGNT